MKKCEEKNCEEIIPDHLCFCENHSGRKPDHFDPSRGYKGRHSTGGPYRTPYC